MNEHNTQNINKTFEAKSKKAWRAPSIEIITPIKLTAGGSAAKKGEDATYAPIS